MLDLLHMASNGWYSPEVLPEGVKSVNEAESIVKKLIEKIQNEKDRSKISN